MTKKVYRSAQGKVVDLGSLLLQNEHVRAVGNMNVNARGDVIDSSNIVIDQKNRQIQRQIQRQTTNVSDMPVATSSLKAKKPRNNPEPEIPQVRPLPEDTSTVETVNDLEQSTPDNETTNESIPRGGLAAAIARARTVKQELDKTPKQRTLDQGLKKI
jgi:hypothetical protein